MSLLSAVVDTLAKMRDTVWRHLPPPRAFDVSSLPAPPWVAMPQWPADSPGWRMGGEQHFFQVRAMYEALSPSEQAGYDRAYPAPPEWEDYLRRSRRGLRLGRRPKR